VCPEQRIELVDVEDEGIRPVVLGSRFLVLVLGSEMPDLLSHSASKSKRREIRKDVKTAGCVWRFARV